MKAFVAVLTVLFVLFVILLLRRGARYRRLYANEHLLELAALAQALWKPAAAAQAADALPPHFTTSAGLRFVHARKQVGAKLNHEVSVSMGEQVLAMGAARAVIAFALDLPRIDPERVTVTHRNVVTHAAFTLTKAEEQAYSAASPVLSPSEAQSRMQRALAARRKLTVVVPRTAR